MRIYFLLIYLPFTLENLIRSKLSKQILLAPYKHDQFIKYVLIIMCSSSVLISKSAHFSSLTHKTFLIFNTTPGKLLLQLKLIGFIEVHGSKRIIGITSLLRIAGIVLLTSVLVIRNSTWLQNLLCDCITN